MGQNPSEEWKGYQHQLFQDKQERGIFIDGTEEEGCTKILRHPRCRDGLLGFLLDDEKREMDTAWKLFWEACKKYPKNDYMGFRVYTDPNDRTKRGDYKWMSYEKFGNMAVNFGVGLRTLGIKDESNIGIFAVNRPEWFLVHMGNLSQSYRTTALYDTLGPEAISYIIKHAECPVIVTEKHKLKLLMEALKNVKKKCEEEKDEFPVKYVIQFDYDSLYENKCESMNEEDQTVFLNEFYGIELIGLNTRVLKDGDMEENKSKFKDENLPKKEDIAYIMYTSGTTGNPKGVVLTHQAFAIEVASMTRAVNPRSDDIHLSYLPLAHIFEATIQAQTASVGAKCAFYQGNVKKLSEDWQAIRPTVLAGVPRVFNKTYEKFKLGVSQLSGVKKVLVNKATNAATKNIKHGKRNQFYDKVVWKGLCEKVGFDRVRLTVSAAAPLPPHLAEFLRIMLPGSSVQQGYGLTESCGACTLSEGEDLALGHVGAPTDTSEIRLIDAPECGYKTTDKPYPRGEVQIRGLNMMNGYYKNQEATNKVLNKETGWFSTGDIGRINPNGTLSIIDRRKNLFKTSTGEYVASEKVEQHYQIASLVGQIWVYGNSFKSFVVAIVVPDAQVLVERLKADEKWSADDEKIEVATKEYADRFQKVCKLHREQIKKWVLADMKQYEQPLKRFEKIKDIYLEFEIDDLLQGWNVDNGLLTPTFKKKRPQLLNKYVDYIKALYTANGEPPNEDENWVKK